MFTDLFSKKVTKLLPKAHGKITSLTISADSNYFFTAEDDRDGVYYIKVWDVINKTLLWGFRTEYVVDAIKVTKDMTFLIVI